MNASARSPGRPESYACAWRCCAKQDKTLNGNSRAQLSIALFCYRLARALLGLMTALSSIDALIFTGGIGENNASIRAQVLTDLARRGIRFVGRDGLRAVPFFFWSWHPVTSRTARRPSCLEKRNVSASLSFGRLLFKTSIAL